MKKEPLLRLVKRDALPAWKIVLIYAIAIVASLLISAIICSLFSSKNPIDFFVALFDGAIGSARRIWLLLQDTALLLGVAVALVPAFKMKFWNLGGNGQILIGCLSAIACMFYLGGKIPEWALLLLMLVAAVLMGAVWGVVPAVFKAKWQTNETLFTLMMNYVAIGLVGFALKIWVDSGSGTLGEMKFGHLPQVGHKYLLLVLCTLMLTALVYIYLNYTKHGYEISVVGESENTARYIGINVGGVIIRTMIVSGAICGLAGFLIVSALDHSITTTTVGGLGFTAIMVSWLAKFNPVIMIGSSLLIALLQQGASSISDSFRIDSSFPDMVVGIVLFFIIGCEFFINYQLKFRESAKKGEKA